MASEGGRFLYDGDSALLSEYAFWAKRRMRGAIPVLAAVSDLPRAEGTDSATHAATWIEDDITYGGHEAISRSLLHMNMPWRLVGRMLLWPSLGVPASRAFSSLVRLRRQVSVEPVGESVSPTGHRRSWRSALGIDKTPLASTAMTLILLLGLVVVARVVRKVAHPSEAAFTHSTVLIGIVAERSIAAIPLALSFLAFFIRRRVNWQDVFGGTRLRPFIQVAAATLVVTAVFYEPNYYFGQMHIFDRLLAVALFALIWIRPIAVLPFAVFVVTAAAQFDYPAGGYTWSHKRAIVLILLLFGILIASGSGRTLRSIRSFFAASCVMLIVWYFAAGVGKILMSWIGLEDLSNLAASMHVNGWLPSSIAEPQIAVLSQINFLMVPGTILIESASILLLAGRRLALIVLPALIFLHLFIFVTSGINFVSTWTVVEIALFVYILRGGEGVARASPVLLVGVILITVLAPYLYTTFRLVWLDTPFTVTYELEAVGRSGTHYRVDRGTMAPYDFAFAHNYFSYISDVPLASIHAFGATRAPNVARALSKVSDPGDIAEVEDEYGRSYYDDQLASNFDKLVRARFMRPSGSLPVHPFHEIWVGPPPIIKDSPARTLYRRQEPIDWVNVRLTKTWWDGEEFHVLATCVVREIEVAGSEVRRPDTSDCQIPRPVSPPAARTTRSGTHA